MRDRCTWDAPLHSLADITSLEWKPKAINSKPSRFGSIEEVLSIYAHCAAEGIAIYGGGQGEVECGRGQIQYLASLFHADTPNDIGSLRLQRPGRACRACRRAPMDPVPSATGFRWG